MVDTVTSYRLQIPSTESPTTTPSSCCGLLVCNLFSNQHQAAAVDILCLFAFYILCLPPSKDGMDQAKWCVPRLRGHQTGKELGKFQRPRLKLHAIWVVGVGLFMYLVDPRQASDASLVVEAAALALEQVKQKLGDQMPHTITVLCDNTVRENKNNVVLGLMAVLTARGHFRTSSVLMARVGHTHNSLGSWDFFNPQ